VDVPHTLIEPRFREASRYYKTRLFELSPFETTIFLDDDTLILSPFGSLDELLGEKSVAMALDPFANLGLWKDHVVGHCKGVTAAWDTFVLYVHPGIRSSPYFNSGVMVWRKDRTAGSLFEYWHELWKMGGEGPDQTWLAIAILELEIPVAHLPLNMNFYPIPEQCHGHADYPTLEEASIIHFLSSGGKRKLREMVKQDAPAHPATWRRQLPPCWNKHILQMRPTGSGRSDQEHVLCNR
jgi:lipopolysaccharide biosynthesis glycosyltransferase